MTTRSSIIDENFDCECFVCHDVRHRIEQILNVLKIYGWLTDSYIVVSWFILISLYISMHTICFGQIKKIFQQYNVCECFYPWNNHY